MSQPDLRVPYVEDAQIKLLRDLTDVWQELCDCNGPQPAIGDLKLSQHSGDCSFVLWAGRSGFDPAGRVD